MFNLLMVLIFFVDLHHNQNQTIMKTKAELIKERDALVKAFRDGYLTTNEYQDTYYNLTRLITS